MSKCVLLFAYWVKTYQIRPVFLLQF